MISRENCLGDEVQQHHKMTVSNGIHLLTLKGKQLAQAGLIE